MVDTANANPTLANPRRARPAACALALALTALPAAAAAQCDAGDAGIDPGTVGTLRDTFPADQGTDVPTNSPVRLRYYGAAPSPPIVCVQQSSFGEPCLPGDAVAVGDEIVWHASGAGGESRLAPSLRYYVTYQEAGSGTNRITFATGRGPSPERLLFGGVTDASSKANESDPCDPDSVDITVTFNRASLAPGGFMNAAWPESDIEYVIYETRGPGISGPRERDRVRLQRSGSASVTGAQRSFKLPGADASGPVCFNVQAVDPLGRADGNTAESCVNPGKGNHFEGCAASPGARLPAPWAALAVALAVAARRRARR